MTVCTVHNLAVHRIRLGAFRVDQKHCEARGQNYERRHRYYRCGKQYGGGRQPLAGGDLSSAGREVARVSGEATAERGRVEGRARTGHRTFQ